jgi:hypothetical protein
LVPVIGFLLIVLGTGGKFAQLTFGEELGAQLTPGEELVAQLTFGEDLAGQSKAVAAGFDALFFVGVHYWDLLIKIIKEPDRQPIGL